MGYLAVEDLYSQFSMFNALVFPSKKIRYEKIQGIDTIDYLFHDFFMCIT